MARKRRSFARDRRVKRPYKRRFIVATEGFVTEPTYFNCIRSLSDKCAIKVVRSQTKSDPLNLLKRIAKAISEEGLEVGDQAWIVCDRDSWKVDHIQRLVNWSDKSDQHGLALSNPCFELWLLFHFEDSPAVGSASTLRKNLRNYLPSYQKELPIDTFTVDQINRAIEAARRKHSLYSINRWTENEGVSSMYKLIEQLV